jgi:formylglycine-generating enzyme required for sulfatase activity
MGSISQWAELDERPTHSVTLRSFWLSKYETTNAQLRDVMQWALDNGKVFRTDSILMNVEGDQRPLLDLSRSGIRLKDGRFSLHEVTEIQPCLEITWYGAQAFCNYLSEIEGLQPCIDLSDWSCDFTKGGYRLPTEAEWEFACRAGTVTDFFSGDLLHPIHDPVDPSLDTIGWYRGNIEGHINGVGEKEANAWALHDMSGGVAEWCYDWYDREYYQKSPGVDRALHDMSGGVAEWCYDWYDREYYQKSPGVDPRGPMRGEDRVKRGGSSFDFARHCRSSYRGLSSPDGSYGNLGFRPARSWQD